MKSLPVGQQSFADLLKNNCYYVDKTMYIQAVMQHDAQVLLITRPRRFGKTLFMHTLREFVQIDCDNPGSRESQARLFSGLKVLEDKPFCDAFMGQYPVVFMSLKDVDDTAFIGAYEALARHIANKAMEYAFLQNSPQLLPQERKRFSQYMDADFLKDISNKDCIKAFLSDLTSYLGKHYGRKVVLLIDEYDVPLAKAAAHGYYDEMLPLIRGMLSEALKPGPTPNEYLRKAVLTGCLRVSKESIFTGLNNPGINTVFSEDNTLSEAIGFTETEVRALLDYYELGACFEKVKLWYDGYRFNEREIYCPWDVINFCSDARKSKNPIQSPLLNYWAGSSSNAVIDEFLGFLSGDETDKMQTLVDGGTIDITVNDKLNYGDLASHDPNDFWTLLFFTGYLTIAERKPESPLDLRVRIPNEEIRDTFKKNVLRHFSKQNPVCAQHGVQLAKAALAGDARGVKSVLLPVLRNYVSVRDAATRAKPENFYHGFLVALLSCAGAAIENFSSNGEAGDGYADLLFTSPDGSVGVVIELKCCRQTNTLVDAAEAALKQVRERNYGQGLRAYDCQTCYSYGIAFCNKYCVVREQEIELEAE